MKIIITPVGSVGDVHPFIGLGESLQSRGHQVTVLINEYFEPLLAKTSLNYIITSDKVGIEYAMNHPDLWHPSKGVPLVAKYLYEPAMRFTFPYLKAHADPDDTLVLGPGWAFGARLANEVLGIPFLTTNVAPSQFRSSIKPPKFGGLWLPDWTPNWMGDKVWSLVDWLVIDRALSPCLNTYRKELGLKPVKRIFHYWMNSANGVLGLFPEWFGKPQQDWPKPHFLTGFPLYDESAHFPANLELDEFLLQNPNPLVFTPGSANQHANDFFEIAVDLCDRFNRPGILLTQFKQQIPKNLPEQVRHFSYLPLSKVLPKASAFIHHGGIGSCAQALSAGVPQLITAMAFDQHDNGRRIEGLGLGQWVDIKRYHKKRAEKLLSDLLQDDRLKARCEFYRDQIAEQDALAETCRIIERVNNATESFKQARIG